MTLDLPGFARLALDVLFVRGQTGQALVYAMFALASVGALSLTGLVLARSGRLAAGSSLVEYAANVRACAPVILLQASMLVLIGLEGYFDARLTAALGWDFTWMVYAVEGNAAAAFQRAIHGSTVGPIVDTASVLVYTWGAFVVFTLPFYLLVFRGHRAAARRVGFTIATMWGIALVFYAFVPVMEVWAVDYGGVVNIMFLVSPEMASNAVYLANVNNNFPSLHAGMTMAVALACLGAGERRLGRVCLAIALGVAFTTIYLGIHWWLDLVAGWATAWAVARYWTRRIPHVAGASVAAASPVFMDAGGAGGRER